MASADQPQLIQAPKSLLKLNNSQQTLLGRTISQSSQNIDDKVAKTFDKAQKIVKFGKDEKNENEDDWGDSDDAQGNEELMKLILKRQSTTESPVQQKPTGIAQHPNYHAQKTQNRKSGFGQRAMNRQSGYGRTRTFNGRLDSESEDSVEREQTRVNQVDQTNFIKSKFKNWFKNEAMEAKEDPLELIDAYERNKSLSAENLIENQTKLLNYCRNNNRIKRDILRVEPVKNLPKLIDYQDARATCINLLGQYLFVGDTNGRVRLYDISKSNAKQALKQYAHEQCEYDQVTVIEFSQSKESKDDNFMIIGHKSGAISIWDLQLGTMEKYIKDEKFHKLEVLAISCFRQKSSKEIEIISTDYLGKVFYSLIGIKTKDFQTHKLIDRALLVPLSLAFKKESQTGGITGNQQLFAVGAYNQVFIVNISTEETAGKVKVNQKTEMKIKRPTFLERTAFRQVIFGKRNYLNIKTTKQQNILCVVWDKLIQFCVIDDTHKNFSMDGYYLSSSPINYAYFQDLSIITILTVDGLKTLHTTKFLRGDIADIIELDEETLDDLVQQSKQAEIEKGEPTKTYQLQKLRYFSYDKDETTQIFNRSCCHNGRIALFLHQDGLTRISSQTISEYLELIKAQKDVTWINKMRFLLDLYQGNCIGFSETHDNVNKAKAQLREFLTINFKQFLKNVLGSMQSEQSEGEPISDKNRNIYKSLVEFCLLMDKDMDLLFTQSFELIQGDQREDFYKIIYEFVCNGLFKDIVLPFEIIDHLILIADYSTFESLITNLNLSNYASKIQDLEQRCMKWNIFQAVFHVNMAMLNLKEKDLQQVNVSCFNTLETLYQVMNNTQQSQADSPLLLMSSDSVSSTDKTLKTTFEKIFEAKRDLARLQSSSFKQQKLFTNSKSFLGYKLMWLLKMLIEGKKFPTDVLSTSQHKAYVKDIKEFLSQEERFITLLKFDSKILFKVIALLFKGKAWTYLNEIVDNSNEFVMKLKEMTEEGAKNEKFGMNRIMNNFYAFVLQVSVQQNQEKQNGNTQVVELDQAIIRQSLRSALHPNELNNKQCFRVNETLILSALRGRKFEISELKHLQQVLVDQEKNYVNYTQNVAIELIEQQKDYYQALKCLLSEQSRNDNIYNWIKHKIQLLDEDQTPESKLQLSQFIQGVKGLICQMVQFEVTNAQKTNQVKFTRTNSRRTMSNLRTPSNYQRASSSMESRFFDQMPEVHCQNTFRTLKEIFGENDYEGFCKLGLEAFGKNENLQMHYLKTFIVLENARIVKTLEDYKNSDDYTKNANQVEIYKMIMSTFVQGLCEFESTSVEEWVNKDYFPADECLKVCQERKNYVGIATIMIRKNDGKEAIKNYVEQIKQTIKLDRLFDQVQTLYKMQIDDFNENDLDNVALFDNLLDKAACIACTPSQHDSSKPRFGEEAQLLVLDGLHKFVLACEKKLPEFVKKTHQTDNQEQIKLNFKKFMQKRYQNILQRERMIVSLKTMSERLDLEVSDIEVFSTHLLSQLRLTKMRNGALSKIQEIDLFEMIERQVRNVSNGTYLPSLKDEKTMKYKTTQECSICQQKLFNLGDITPIDAFSCGHFFHLTCSNEEKHCQSCLKQEVVYEEDESENIIDKKNLQEKSQQLALDQRNKRLMRNLEKLDAQMHDNNQQYANFENYNLIY